MDAQQQQTEGTEPTQTTVSQAAAWHSVEQSGTEPAQAGTHIAEMSSKRTAVLKQPAFWRRMRQKILPETTWLAELMREAGPHFGGQTPRRWVRHLNSSNAHIRQEARRAYHSLPPPARCVLTASAYIRAIEFINNAGFITGALVVIGVIASAIMGGIAGAITGIILTALLAGVMTNHIRTERLPTLAKDLLDGAQDARLIPFLALRLMFIRSGSKLGISFAGRNLRNALVRLLPLAQQADAAEWTGAHWNSLLRCLRKPYADIELTEAVLQTMARVGNEEAYRAIQQMGLEPSVEERLATRKKRAARVANQQLLSQVKQECLPVLAARLNEQRQAQTLLRPSGAAFLTASGSDVLLRPAQAYVGETPAEQLLRPQSRE